VKATNKLQKYQYRKYYVRLTGDTVAILANPVTGLYEGTVSVSECGKKCYIWGRWYVLREDGIATLDNEIGHALTVPHLAN